MLERKLYPKFQKKIYEADPKCFCYKIPDFPGSTKRPFDFLLLFKGCPFAIEFKSKKGTLTKYQEYMLGLFFMAGGVSLLFTEGDNMDLFIEHIKEMANEPSKRKSCI